ncbi:glycosyltransferase family 2 protein [Parvibacter caecicola]|uniref:Glycosyltransferase involved in cell wall biosynthesis n=1 Tax=Parvibacter caecicola TaxID=747645 RepID=A0A7W5D1L4_9ACTN|nr:glycosyltransferase family 2 protein [Parvibacter caecicola]MBB3171204.1 glycosyltransferase involved in cell wall biosynthesis [Parvibacter caecicola]MCR2042004.1 glycosyltransferase [Parvibacter caecicola]
MKAPKFLRRLLGKQHSAPRPSSYAPSSSYAIVSAAYNVAPYLDEFFGSIAQQTIDRRFLSVVVVDDGSTDETAAICERWAEELPGQVTLIRQENGGQAAARNHGLQLVSAEWVTFTDPDDFLAPDYFETVDRAISRHPDAVFLATKFFPYDESTGTTTAKHPLNWRFTNDGAFYSVLDESMPMALSMASGFFKTEHIEDESLKASTEIKPVFEDAHFVGRYLASAKSGTAGFLGSAKYYYRKRADESSTMDHSWDGTDRLLTVPRMGHADLLRYAQEARGEIPAFAKLTVLYDIGWYFRNHVDHPELGDHFTSTDIAEGRRLLEENLQAIGYDMLFSPQNKAMGFDHKAAIAKTFFGKNPPFQKAYLIASDTENCRLTFRTFVSAPAVFVDEQRVDPALDTLQRFFWGEPFYCRYTLEIPYQSTSSRVRFDFGDRLPVQIDTKGTVLPNGSTVAEFLAHM